ncbi:MAG: hypothetical protein PHN57_02845 [Candidatus Omnitrophica bacterium]|nr:hypothetical protein [Candidatus Omnitrophota bacterium]
MFKKLLLYLESEEKASGKSVSRIYVSVSELSGFSKEHFLEHFRQASTGTRWQGLDMEIKAIPYGAEFEITRIEFK